MVSAEVGADMIVSLENIGEVKRSVSCEVPTGIFEQRFERALAAAQLRSNIKGFRPGRAPRGLVANLHGPAIKRDILGEIIKETYDNVVRDHKLNVVGFPEVEILDTDEGENYKFTLSLDIFPEPVIKDYVGFECEYEVEKTECSEEHVNEHINNLCRRFSKFHPITDRTVTQKGDIVVFGVSATFDGESIDEASGSYMVAELNDEESKEFPKELIDGLLGLEVGVKSDIFVEAPKDHPNEKLAGQKVCHSVTVKKISTRELPIFDDAFLQKTGFAGSVEEFMRLVQQHHKRDVKKRNEIARHNAYLDEVLKRNKFELPHSLVDGEIRFMLAEIGVLDRNSKDFTRIDVTQYRQALGEMAETRLRRAVVLDRIMEQEEREVSDEDVQQWMDEKAIEFDMDVENVGYFLGLPHAKSSLREYVNRMKTLEHLIGQCVVMEKLKA
ncbi:MAG: trigger factor [Deltaproteobacteria bacterium]|nr:trigger factor [Deltaproteobacteria bacterium]